MLKKSPKYVCPGCLFLGSETLVSFRKIFKCRVCDVQLNSTTNPQLRLLYKTFASYNKSGYKCQDCERFLPHPIDGNVKITCPYSDCCFVGDFSSLKKMHHPVAKSVADNNLYAPVQEIDCLVKSLQDIMYSQSKSIAYTSSDFTIKHKSLIYQSFLFYLDKFPKEMSKYLLQNSRRGGFQSKIFQKYIDLLEQSLPFSFKKNGKFYQITSLLDENLSLFDGISTFEGIIDEKYEIKNNTKEFYIGGRLGTCAQPFYIGKLLDIKDSEKNESLISLVDEYSFSKIKMQNTFTPGTQVIVSHLRIPPHYQMGGMSYLNRIRKNIVEEAKSILESGNYGNCSAQKK